MFGISRPEKALLLYYALSALFTAVMWPLVMIPLYFRYETLQYRFDAHGVFMKYGVLFRREMQLTYARMQDIHLSQNILERWLGIGTVTIQTAGASGGDLTIAGVKDFEAIRDYLYARMRGVHGAEAHPAQGNELGEIRDALNRAAQALEKLKTQKVVS
ncbi:MAG: PH domain-containing protein [Myxococcaceae bacterium]